jgi:hypothetical protein
MTDATYMTTMELARHWRVTRRTLLNYRHDNIGPQPIQLLPGQRGLRYLRADVEAFDAERRRAAGKPPQEA